MRDSPNKNDKESSSITSGDDGLSSALAQLRLKLLDLTGRNKLINFKHTAGKSLQFIEGQPSDIYKKLVEANAKSTISILGLPEPTKRDWIERNGRLSRPDPRDWANDQGIYTRYELPELDENIDEQPNVRALLYSDDLAKHCRKIEREAVLAIEETGANMLFLVLGFLEFPDQKDSDRTFAAPLISIPVLMSKREVNGIQSFFLQFTGDDITENLSLREKLRNDFGVILPELNEDQLDVEQYFAEIRSIIKFKPSFALKRRISLCLLSFTNMLLVRDLDPSKWPQDGAQNGLVDHPIVREVFEGKLGETASGLGIAVEHPVESVSAANIPLVYDADSSQHSALVDVLIEKKNLVIEGPPGTGKSQTITNLIAACLSEGKKVLFVAEKLAALEVVKNRLTMAGLDPFVLELHSNKTNKKRVLEEIGKRVLFRPNHPADLPRLLHQVESHRNDLKAYADLINSVVHNSFGLTLHQVMWRAERHRSALTIDEAPLTQVAIADGTQISEFELSRRMDCLGHIGSQYSCIGNFDTHSTFWGFFPELIVPGDDVRLTNLFSSSCSWSQKMIEDAEAFATLLGGNIVGLTLEFANAQIRVLTDFLNNAHLEQPLHLIPGFFEIDKTGIKARLCLEALSLQQQRYHSLLPRVKAALLSEESVTKNSLAGLRLLEQSAEKLGVTLADLDELRSLGSRLEQAVTKLNSSIQASKVFAEGRGIVFDGTRGNLEQLEVFSALIVELPEEHLHLQSAGLMKDGAAKAIEALAVSQSQLINFQQELDEILYLDALPDEGTIKQAILILREGDAWYRIFQSRWRSAVGLHKNLQRTKRKMAGKDRLAQLEKIANFLQQNEKWKSDPAWIQILGFQAPANQITLDGYITLSKWNRKVRLALEEIRVTIIDPENLTTDKARSLRREFAPFRNDLVTAIRSLKSIDNDLPKLLELPDTQAIKNSIGYAHDFWERIQTQIKWLEQGAQRQASFASVIAGCVATLGRRELADAINNNAEAKRLLDVLFLSVDTDVSGALEALAFGQSIDGLNLSAQIKARLRFSHPIESAKAIKTAMEAVTTGLAAVSELDREMKSFGEFDLNTWIGLDPQIDLFDFSEALLYQLEDAVDKSDLLIPWSLYVARRKEARELGLIDFVTLLEEKKVNPVELPNAYAYCTYGTIVREAFRHIPQLGRFSGLKHNQIRDEFKRLDGEIIKLRGKSIASNCYSAANPPGGRNGVRVDDKTEMVLLNYLLPQQRPRMPVRKMLKRAGRSFQDLKPCFMMGPQAVAQYLTPGAIKFDLVIMDEASQLKPEEAIGAIARGGQLVVVGDPKQLPPTSFFSRMSQASDEDDQYSTTDAESILDVCSSHFRPTRSLRWHYRSQHHSLIAFSNQNFYRGNLIIFPSPYGQSSRLGVRATYLADAVYENQTNLREAKRLVDAVVEHITHRPKDSLGVVTLNIKQRDLIAELIEERLKTVQEADTYRDYWTVEGQPLFIKNLENVQGDERDAIIISTTFGKPAGSSAVRQNFGPISRQGGWRRLNVLFTRAKKSIAIYTSLRPEDIVMDGTTPEGTKALRNYLEYARTGSLSVAEETGREPDSDFEISVMDILKTRGYEVTPQLGVAGYRIDIAVKHPDAPGTYLAAIECDGASYHSALSVRDRDRIRQEVLESLGWRGRIWRIWSTDWFRTPRQEAAKLLSFLEDLRKSWKPEHSSGDSWVEEGELASSLKSNQLKSSVIAATGINGTPTNQMPLELDRQIVNAVLVDSDDDLEVEVGDVVKYIDVTKTDDVLTVKITQKITDITNGIIAEATPLAQALLGAVVGDEVTLHIPSVLPKVFRIHEIKRVHI